MAQTVPGSSNEELAAVKDDLNQLKKDLAELLSVVKESGKAKASNLEQDALNAVHSAIDTLNQRFTEAKVGVTNQTHATLDQAEQLVDRHPVATLLTAFGVGFLLAKLFSKN
ncbi:MAG: DUF883 family protein [Halothiobacillus sp.]